MLVTLVLVSMLNIMGGAAVAPALPAMTEAFPEAGETMVSLVLTLPPLAVALSGLFIGALADRVGKARTLTVSIVVFTIAGLSGLFLPSLEAILVSRFIRGWRAPFLVYSVGILFAILVLLFIREPQNEAAKGQAPLGETDAGTIPKSCNPHRWSSQSALAEHLLHRPSRTSSPPRCRIFWRDSGLTQR